MTKASSLALACTTRIKCGPEVIIDYLATHGRARNSALALVDLATDRRWSWAELDSAANRCADWLIGQFGPQSGERVAIIARNSADMILLQFGCVRAGAIFVPLNWRLASTEIAGLIADATPALLLTDVAMPDINFSGTQHLICDLDALTAGSRSEPLPKSARRPWDAPSTLLYTSGTSGTPKGVMISEENAYWGSVNFVLGNGVSQDSVFLCDMPLFHTAGLFANARTPILAGGTLLVSKGFDPDMTLQRLSDAALGITHYFSVPQMAQMLWNQPGFDPAKLSRLQVYATGGAPNPAAQIERFVGAGISMSDGFGMTETGSNFGMPLDDAALLMSKAGSIGLPYLAVEACIVNEAGEIVPVGEIGELWVRGPSISSGYWNQPDRTAAAFDGDWFKTGDAARSDADGYYFLVDRKKDMFISGGENVYPAEVEAVIAEIEDVAECAVVGVPDDKWGEVGIAYIVPAPGKNVTGNDVLTFCKSRLAAFKTPKSVVIMDALPRTASGKVQKHILMENAQINWLAFSAKNPSMPAQTDNNPQA